MIGGRDAEALTAAVDTITNAGGLAVGVAGSAANERVAGELIQTCGREYGPVDILINCAGIAEPPGSSILTVTPTQFQEQLDAHLGAVFHTCRTAAPIMVSRGSGTIITPARPPRSATTGEPVTPRARVQ